MAEPTEHLGDSYKIAVVVAALMWLLRALLPKGYHFRFIRLYAERDDPTPADAEEADDD